MMSLNDNEKDFQKKLQEETEIPLIVHEHISRMMKMLPMQSRIPFFPAMKI